MFTPQKALPKTGNKFYNTSNKGGYSECIQGKPVVSGLNVLCNCVGWACGRFNEIYSQESGYKGMKYWQLNCNAENFIERGKTVGLTYQNAPVAGGIMVWEGKGSLAGHVAVVEQVIKDNEKVLTSDSGYNHFSFANYTRNKGNGNWGLSDSFKYLGCIINPAVKPDPQPTPPSPGSFFPPKGYFSLGDTSPNVGKIASFMRRCFPAYTSAKALGNYYGPYIKASITEFQRRTGLKPDGCVGPITLNKLKQYGFRP